MQAMLVVVLWGGALSCCNFQLSAHLPACANVLLPSGIVKEHISVLILCHPLVRELGFGIDVFADLFVSARDKLETCGAMIADAHVHMSSNAMLGFSNSAPCCWCTPPASWSATSRQSEVLAACDHDNEPQQHHKAPEEERAAAPHSKGGANAESQSEASQSQIC